MRGSGAAHMGERGGEHALGDDSGLCVDALGVFVVGASVASASRNAFTSGASLASEDMAANRLHLDGPLPDRNDLIIVTMAHGRGLLLVVDQGWGAHFVFHPHPYRMM